MAETPDAHQGWSKKQNCCESLKLVKSWQNSPLSPDFFLQNLENEDFVKKVVLQKARIFQGCHCVECRATFSAFEIKAELERQSK